MARDQTPSPPLVMVLIDTSIWISLYRKKTAAMGELVWSLVGRNEAAICGQVWVEFLGGFRKENERADYAKALRAFPWLETRQEEYLLAADLLAGSPHLGSGDVIIAATAIRHRCPLLTLDRDFRPLASRGLALLNT